MFDDFNTQIQCDDCIGQDLDTVDLMQDANEHNQAVEEYKTAFYRMHVATRLSNSETYTIADRELIRIDRLAESRGWTLPKFLGWNDSSWTKEMVWSF